jgi:hypothetical protein
MKLYHPTTEQEEAAIRTRGFRDTMHHFGTDAAGRLSIRVAVGFSDGRPRQAMPGACWIEIEVPDDIAALFEDTLDEPGEGDGSYRLFYLPGVLATYYLRKQ